MKITFSKFLPKGSVLVFSLIILSIMLVTSLMLLSSASMEQKSALSTGNSTRSFQVADAGIEQVLYQIYRKHLGSIGDLAGELGISCDDGTVTDEDAGWSVRFYDLDGNVMTDCADDGWRDRVAAIKSEGAAQGTIRAVEVVVAAEGTPGIVGGCAVNGDSVLIEEDSSWGNGCRPEGSSITATNGRQACKDASESGYSCGLTSSGANDTDAEDLGFCSCVED